MNRNFLLEDTKASAVWNKSFNHPFIHLSFKEFLTSVQIVLIWELLSIDCLASVSWASMAVSSFPSFSPARLISVILSAGAWRRSSAASDGWLERTEAGGDLIEASATGRVDAADGPAALKHREFCNCIWANCHFSGYLLLITAIPKIIPRHSQNGLFLVKFEKWDFIFSDMQMIIARENTYK